MTETGTECNQIKAELDTDARLSNYEEFKRRAKALSHVKVQRSIGYFHHFIIISITRVKDNLDAVTVGHYTTSGEIFTENSQGIGKFVRQTIILGEERTHQIFDFEKGLYLVETAVDSVENAFGRLEEMIDERIYELSSNNCEHSIKYILTGRDKKNQADTQEPSKRGCIDLCDVVIIDCKNVGFKTALAIAALGAIAGSLVRRAYVNVIVSTMVSYYTTGDTVADCGILIGSNIRSEAQRRIDLSKQLPDINTNENNSDLLDKMENHLQSTFVCEIAETLIYDTSLKTCASTLVVAASIETIFLLFYVHFNLLSRRRRHCMSPKKFCRILFLRIFGGYCSIIIAVFPIGIPVFLYIDRPAFAFFCSVFISTVVLRYILTLTAGFCFDCCCCSCWYNCCNCCSWCGPCCDYRCWKCSCSTLVVFVVVLLITVVISLGLGFYFLI